MPVAVLEVGEELFYLVEALGVCEVDCCLEVDCVGFDVVGDYCAEADVVVVWDVVESVFGGVLEDFVGVACAGGGCVVAGGGAELLYDGYGDLGGYAILHFLESHLGYKNFVYYYDDNIINSNRIFYCPNWKHIFNYKNSNTIEATFVEIVAPVTPEF